MALKLIIYSVVSAYLLREIHCSQSWESVINSSTESSLSAKNSNSYSNSEEVGVLTDSYKNQNQEDFRLYSNPYENVQDSDIYETEEPRKNVQHITFPDDYRNHINYHKQPSVQRNPYMGSRYQPYSNIPSNNIYNYSPKRPPTSMIADQFKQQPVYANLYWRKIIYPHPQYSTQNNDNVMILENNLGNPKTEESQIVNRRYITGNPYKKYYRYRNRYPSTHSGNRRNLLTSFYPIPGYSVRNRNHLLRFKPNSAYSKSPALYNRKRRVRPIRPISNHYNSIQSNS